ncbi:hypothetical protein LTR37_015550 [Vermiconidia calcicola]|uniref:Uncharacterized protein n=1 Tax=Vermiconidia calcicola TaxID=1690605 RepID=A0ACC3MQF1_9PEZI|nr:hypothetical protein LTR37_015550 [Vermiconidia calcicola]
MEKTEKTHGVDLDLDIEEDQTHTPRQKRNLTMVYLLFLAEAIMSASLSSHIAILVHSETNCLSMDTSFLRSILQVAYYFGSAMGLFWGRAADKFGRRRVALVGLAGMSTCCISMGFATSFPAFAMLRCFAGAVSSATTISGLAMLADLTQGHKARTKVVARLPVIAVCGNIGPLAAHMWHNAFDGHLFEVFAKYPGPSGQLACGGLVISIAVAVALLLEDTLPSRNRKQNDCEGHADCEKAAFLGQSLSNDADDNLNITIIETLNDAAAAPLPSRIGVMQLLTAPTVLLLLISFSLLSLHAPTFDILLPHIGHNGGIGIPCSWLHPITTVVTALAAIRVSRLVPRIVGRVGLLTMYRRISIAFPVLYIVVPLVAIFVNATGASPIISGIVSTIALFFKTTLADAAHVLVLLLALSAAPDAYSTGTVLGVVSISELFKALAVGASGISYSLSDSYSLVIVNGCLWAALSVTALAGIRIAWKLRETPRVGTDIPRDCFEWEGMFDSESEDER